MLTIGTGQNSWPAQIVVEMLNWTREEATIETLGRFKFLDNWFKAKNKTFLIHFSSVVGYLFETVEIRT